MINVIVKDRNGHFHKHSGLGSVGFNEFLLVRLNRLYPDYKYVNCYKYGQQFGSVTRKSFPLVIPIRKSYSFKP